MSFKSTRTCLVLAMVLCAFSVTAAQDVGVPDPEFGSVGRMTYLDPSPLAVTNVSTDVIIDEITDNSEAYYGTIVSFEGTVTEFLSPNVFEVGEEELLGGRYVLAINNTSRPLPPTLMVDTVVRLTGRVHPAYNIAGEGGDWTYEPFDPGLAAPAGQVDRLNMVSFVQSGFIPGTYRRHTLVEILNVDNISVLTYAGLIVGD